MLYNLQNLLKTLLLYKYYKNTNPNAYTSEASVNGNSS